MTENAMPWRDGGTWAAIVAVASAIIGYIGALIKRRIDLEREIVLLRSENRTLTRDVLRLSDRMSAVEKSSVTAAEMAARNEASQKYLVEAVKRIENKLDGKADK